MKKFFILEIFAFWRHQQVGYRRHLYHKKMLYQALVSWTAEDPFPVNDKLQYKY